SPTQLRSFLVYVKNSYNGADQFRSYEKEYLAKAIHRYLQFVEKGNAFMTAEVVHRHLQFVEKGNAFMTAEVKDCLQQLQKIFKLEEESVHGKCEKKFGHESLHDKCETKFAQKSKLLRHLKIIHEGRNDYASKLAHIVVILSIVVRSRVPTVNGSKNKLQVIINACAIYEKFDDNSRAEKLAVSVRGDFGINRETHIEMLFFYSLTCWTFICTSIVAAAQESFICTAYIKAKSKAVNSIGDRQLQRKGDRKSWSYSYSADQQRTLVFVGLQEATAREQERLLTPSSLLSRICPGTKTCGARETWGTSFTRSLGEKAFLSTERDTCLEWLLVHANVSCILLQSVNSYLLALHGGRVKQAEPCYWSAYRALVASPGSPYTPSFNRIIRATQESGIVQKYWRLLYEESVVLHNKRISVQASSGIVETSVVPQRNKSYKTVFFLLFTCYVLSLGVFLMELIVKHFCVKLKRRRRRRRGCGNGDEQ
ncbi:unnamed protein product, partial [Trichogramma brassicae]